MEHDIKTIAAAFPLDGELIHIERFGHGHINDTYAVYYKRDFLRPIRYVIQRINHNVFKDPPGMMENISRVTAHIAEKLTAAGEDPSRRVLHVIKTTGGDFCHIDAGGNYWRALDFIDDATSYQQTTPELFEKSGAAIGWFFSMLSDFPVDTLHESIPDFHNTRARFEAFKNAVARDAAGKAASVREEIEFALARESDAGVLVDMLGAGELPLRVTHNDTKLNNVLIDNTTGEGICVIDLDTVMPGLSVYDFGDSIRFGANTGAEDEQDLSKISLDLNMFEAFARGFIPQARANMSENEMKMLPFASKIMTFECGIRFLADHLAGDVYFKIDRPDHNLDRCRTQFKLVAEMEREMDAMSAIIERYA